MENTSLLDQKSTETIPQVTPPSVGAKGDCTGQRTNDCYVYIHTRNDTGAVFYVGKGRGNRAWRASNRNRWWRAIANKHGYEVTLVASGLDEACAFTFEKIAISGYPKGQLCNLTKGGEGPSGMVHREDSRLKMSLGRIGEKNHFFGKTHSEETRAKLSKAHRGRKRSPLPDHVKDTLRKINTGRKMSDEARSKMSAAWEGRVVTAEWRANMSKARKGKPHSREWVENQAASQRGKKLTEEHKARIGEFHKGKKLSPEHMTAISKPVSCGNGMTFSSGQEAARWVRENTNFIKASRANIGYCLKGKTSHAYGFTWSYL